MTPEDQLTLTLLRGAVVELPKPDQDKVHAAAQQLRDVLAASGDHGVLALALVGAEQQVMRV